jgi:hypothetical protein
MALLEHAQATLRDTCEGVKPRKGMSTASPIVSKTSVMGSGVATGLRLTSTNTKVVARTSVKQNMQYDGLCLPDTLNGPRHCVLIGSADLAEVVARLVWKSEMAHSSGCWELANPKPAAGQSGHRRNAPWESIPGQRRGRLTAGRARSAS